MSYDPKDEYYDFIDTAMMRNMPVVVKGLDYFEAIRSVLDKEQLLTMLQSDTVQDVRAGKNATFMYYSYSSSWHKRYKLKPTHKPLKKVGVSELQNFISIPDICKTVDRGVEGFEGIKNLCKNKYVYGTHDVPTPLLNPVLKKSVPYLYRVAQINDAGPDPSAVLWMTSTNSTAHWHYDLEHNFFWQLFGSKRFLLAPVEMTDQFNTHSFSHPNWRQSQIDPRFSSSSLWEYDITLNQGELLYIPPLMFHSVVSLTNSISLNMWAFSDEMKATEELKKVQLPFKIDDAISLKAASLAKAISIVVAKIFDYTVTGNVQQVPSALHKVYKEFFNRWQRRWSSIVHDPEFGCNTNSHCSNIANNGKFQEDAGSTDTCKSDLQLFTRDQFWGAALNPKVLEYTESIWKVLNVIGQEESRHGMRKPSSRMTEIRTKNQILFMSYLEEVAGVALVDHNSEFKNASPCELDAFVDQIKVSLNLV